MNRNHVSVYRDGVVEHYAQNRYGHVLRGLNGYIAWDGDEPSTGWERVVDDRYADAIRVMLRGSAARYGDEWCPCCHVFHAHPIGEKTDAGVETKPCPRQRP